MRSTRLISIMVATSLAAAAGVATMTWIGASAAHEVVRLHLGTDAVRFSLGTVTQPITVGKNSCAINSLEPLIDLSSTSGGSNSNPGLANYGLGVKASPSSGNGSPCAQVDSLEALTLRPGTSPIMSGRTFKSIRFDLELADNAVAVITLTGTAGSATYRLLTGTSITTAELNEPGNDFVAPYFVSSGPGDTTDACAAPNSSGPNNAGNDNCQWTIAPGFNFDTVRLTTEIGTVTLEGSGDFANDPNFDSLFYLSNAAPSAVNDVVTTNEDTAVTFNVLTNDSDADGDTLTVSGNTQPTNGTGATTVSPSGSSTYTPNANYNGTDSFTYTVTDGTDSSTATVTITVTAVNDPPVSISGTATTPEETAVTIPVATDVDSTALTATCSSSAGGGIVDGGLGSVTFTPPLNFNGSTQISCSVVDGQGAPTATPATVTVSVTAVNDPPIANPDSAEVNQNASVVISVLANDTDVDLDSLTVGIGTLSTPGHGTAVIEGTSIRYTPVPGFSGTDSFTYKAFDGTANSNAATVTVTVFPVICSGQSVSDRDGVVEGTFFRLTDSQSCKRYTIDAVADNPLTTTAGDSSVLFDPQGGGTVNYRGELKFEPQTATDGMLNLLLEYDPTGGITFKPVLWCINPQFNGNGEVTSATLPVGETWCIASESSRGNAAGNVVTTWQVFGQDDPRFQ